MRAINRGFRIFSAWALSAQCLGQSISLDIGGGRHFFCTPATLPFEIRLDGIPQPARIVIRSNQTVVKEVAPGDLSGKLEHFFGVPGELYLYDAVATLGNGDCVTSAPVQIGFSQDTIPPNVTLKLGDGKRYFRPGVSIPVAMTVTSCNGVVNPVELFVDGIKSLALEPPFQGELAPLDSGWHEAYAEFKDGFGVAVSARQRFEVAGLSMLPFQRSPEAWGILVKNINPEVPVTIDFSRDLEFWENPISFTVNQHEMEISMSPRDGNQFVRVREGLNSGVRNSQRQ